MITIYNKQRTVKIDREKTGRVMALILKKLRYEDYDVGIMFVNDATMQRYNREYRGYDKPTDILSFPFHAGLKAGKRIVPQSPDDQNLGDLIIDVPYVLRVAQERLIPFDEQVQTLLVHGVFHLLGYDHMNDADYARMRRRERDMLKYVKSVSA
jgi:probable rRNA maturation factor